MQGVRALDFAWTLRSLVLTLSTGVLAEKFIVAKPARLCRRQEAFLQPDLAVARSKPRTLPSQH